MNSTAAPQPDKPRLPRPRWFDLLFAVVGIALILLGVYYRFAWTNWSQGANLHPDEYGLTNTLTALSLPNSLADYFNTRISPLSPYPKYDELGQLVVNGPDNRMQWGQLPITLIRAAGEMTGNTGYDAIRLLGRKLSALADTISLLFLYLIGRRLYNWKIGLLATCLSALVVLQIQQSHFMTVDNFAVCFTMLALYACVRIAQTPLAVRQGASPTVLPVYRPAREAWGWFLLAGAGVGMAVASKINLLPLAGLIAVGAFISIADLKLRTSRDLTRILATTCLMGITAALAMAITFRIAQPMSFRAEVGNTSLLTLHLNPDWVISMQVAANGSNGNGGGPPGDQWVDRPVILFPLVNIVFWGMGLPLGLAVWIGFLAAVFQLIRNGNLWRAHLIPLVWTGGYFLFMATRWVKSIRYFLPIYPFLCLLAAWALIQFWSRGRERKRASAMFLPGLLISLVVLGTLAWANAFTTAVYRNGNTRVDASRWIIENIPAPFELILTGSAGSFNQYISIPDSFQTTPLAPFVQVFTLQTPGSLRKIELPHASTTGLQAATHLQVVISTDPAGQTVLDEAVFTIQPVTSSQAALQTEAEFKGTQLEANRGYFLVARPLEDATVSIWRVALSNENWDEGLPVSVDQIDPFGQLYHPLEMEIRWYEDQNKLDQMLDTLSKVDYILLPSQRGIWTTCRIPRMYPLAIQYYRSLFNGRLGFDLAASFQAPIILGPLEVSDLAGTVSWNSTPILPVFNHSQLAAEEAFSVYDHPPVWIFKKRPDFTLANAQTVLKEVDLTKVVIQNPHQADLPPCP